MKSLQESLFDKDLAEKDLKFGDVYKPKYVTCTDGRDGFKIIENMFSMGKLRKAGKRLDLSRCVSSYTNTNHIEVIELIAGIFAEFPLWDIDFLGNYGKYSKKIEEVFKPLARPPLWGRSIYITISRPYGNDVELAINKSNMTESVRVTIKYEKV